jgi:CxxC motif-containing protein (DUF1111 family)
MHDGEARKAAEEFENLDESSRNALLTFLDSLTLPGS